MFSAKRQDSNAANFACDVFISAFFQKSATLLAWSSSRYLGREEDWGRDGKYQIQAGDGVTSAPRLMDFL